MKYIGYKASTKEIRKMYRVFASFSQNSEYKNEREIALNRHVIRSCSLNILNIKNIWRECSLSETGDIVIWEEARDFCDLSDYSFSEESLTVFLRGLAMRESLTYSDIACLIPAFEYLCLKRLFQNRRTGSLTVLKTLCMLNDYDGSVLAEILSKTEEVLRKDDIYPHLDQSSKRYYRLKIKKLSKKIKLSERNTAVELLKEARRNTDAKSRQIGDLLLAKKKNRWYFPILAFLTVIFGLLSFFLCNHWLLFLFSLIPSALSAKLTCDTVFSRVVSPELLPKIKITKDNCPKSLVTVVSVVSSEPEIKQLLHRLDVLAYRIPISAVSVGLLLDFPSSEAELTESEQELLDLLKCEISKRNQEKSRFFCAVRKRNRNPKTFRYEAYGRKQGAMMDFCDLTAGNPKAFSFVMGDVEDAVYFLPLDSDTQPTPGAVEGLIGFMEHPNHYPETQKDKHGFFYVKKGYGAAAPRVEANPETSFSTPFGELIGADSGTELYKNPHFNLFQDLFGEGIFCGKGILRLELYRNLIANRFRNDPILSHDLPEGEILRCANCTDIVYFDDVPQSVLSDEKRTHRWIRGDFQNASFLRRKNNASHLFRFKIINNIFRALFPVFCFLLAVSGVFYGPKSIFIALFWLVFPLILRIPSLLTALGGKSRKYRPLKDFGTAVSESTLSVLLLPSRAIGNVDAALRGTFRLLFNKNKLEWTTAANAAKNGREISDYFLGLRWQQMGFFLLFAPHTALVGAFWMVAPVFARYISLPHRKRRIEIGKLKSDLVAMWHYYADFMNEENHYLPPDNYQVQPLNITAKHTSPTNIGLALLSVLGAYDLNIIREEELFLRLENTLTTLETLPKWNGLLYNWYDIQTLKVLHPKFISTVDCGNYAVCIYTLKQGMEQFQTPRAEAISRRISALLQQTDFSLLYDKKKKLFPIGYHPEEKRMSSSYYDLYASEARLTSFYAIMQQQIPAEHWIHLGRPSRSRHGKFLPASWSGTMFEYFMPHIFLPAFRNTLSGEMLQGVLSAQRKSVPKNIPWGISESGYYDFDRQLYYQYRAFGIPSAALRRDISFPKVISPYSTFLTYPWFPIQSEENLRKLPKGKYGYYEAVDYRTGTENPRVVQSFMAHHVGMSFLSGVNLVSGKKMQARFMSGRGEAYSSLLAEKIPCVSENIDSEVKPVRTRPFSAEITTDKPDPEHPKVAILTNGIITEILSDSGAGNLLKKGIDLTEPSQTPNSPAGFFLFIRNKGTLYGATYAPLYQPHRYRAYRNDSGMTWYGDFNSFETRFTATISPDTALAVKEVTVKNNLMTEDDFEFFLYVTPVLSSGKDYRAHPEYQDLFIQTVYEPSVPAIFFYRNNRDEHLWFSATADAPFSLQTTKDRVAIFHGNTPEIPQHPIYPCLMMRGRISVRGRGTGTVTFRFSAGKTKEESLEILKKTNALNFEVLRRRYGQSFESRCSALDMEQEDRQIFDFVTSRLFVPEKKAATLKRENTLPLRTLWKYGISSDYPILSLRIGKDCIGQLTPFLRTHTLLCQAALTVDLLIVFREENGYHTPIKTALESLISEVGEGQRQHIFLLNIQTVEEYLLLQKSSFLFLNLERGWKIPAACKTFRPILLEGTPLWEETPVLSLGRGGFGKNQSYLLPKIEKGIFRPCSLVLANHRLGTVVNENNLGYTFSENASENRITPRCRLAAPSEERYFAVIRGKRYDLLQKASAEFRKDRGIYRIDLFGNIIVSEVFVPPYLPVKIIKVTVEKKVTDLEIVYEPTVILDKFDRNTVTRRSEDGAIYFTNAANNYYGAGWGVLFGVETIRKGSGLSFSPEKNNTAYFLLGYGKGLESAKKLVRLLSSEQRIQRESRKAKEKSKNIVEIETSDKNFNFFWNGFLQQQILNSRILARTGPYQPGGAFGFRDQLQDALCLATFRSSYLKHQILRCAAKQFEEGDVLHWWHPRRNGDDGIRTRFSDGPFWLVFACIEYYNITEDPDFFTKQVPYLHGAPLKKSEKDRYFTPEISSVKESVYQHGIRALKWGLKRGKHGCILFGSGDWNDGLNGIEPGGETLWGTMFALLCTEGYQAIAAALNDLDFLEYLQTESEKLREALELYGFENGRYLRGFRINGKPFGEKENIDALPQAFAVFCGLNKDNTEVALENAYQHLWDKERNIIRLSNHSYKREKDGFPGSIADYPPGVRENGGQYTHGGIWLARAFLQSNHTQRGWEILSGINPVNHTDTPQKALQYGAEPYVLAADVYTLPGREGCAGWSHYTGAAGWYFKTVTEDLFGICRRGNRITFSPRLPKDWHYCKVSFKIEKDIFEIRISRGTEKGIFEDNTLVEFIPLNGTKHRIHVIV